MTSKLSFIPVIESYDDMRRMMHDDLEYRLSSRLDKTSFGRPLYKRINVQMIITQACPYKCPFCLERLHPMLGVNHFTDQIESLKKILAEHSDARLTITGGEPGLYPEHVNNLVDVFYERSNTVFCSVNTAGFIKRNVPRLGSDYRVHVNLSWNDYVQPDAKLFPGCTLQTVFDDTQMSLDNVKKFIHDHPECESFSFRFLSGMSKHDYSVRIWNELRSDDDIHVRTFRVGDFFAYATFDYMNTHNRVTLGDMWVQSHNDYCDGYSNIIVHPDGTVNVNWK